MSKAQEKFDFSVHHPFKGIAYPKMTILSSFTCRYVAPNLYEFLSSAEHKKYILKKIGNQTLDGWYDLP